MIYNEPVEGVDLKTNYKVVIYGYPLYSHTHSFIHYGWYKAFKSLGFDTYWFHDKNFPTEFDFRNCIFISEGYADKDIPIEPTSIYFIHICINPTKYIEKGARLIDLRHSVRFLQDFSYDYEMNTQALQRLDNLIYYEENASDIALRDKYRKNVHGYEAIYIIWATDMLPNEIDFSSAYLPRERNIYMIGSVWSANRIEIGEFQDECVKNDINLVIKNFWKDKAVSNEDSKRYIQKSFIAPDIRGSGPISDECVLERSNHLSTGYIPCRVFKNISYGQLGITNSWAVNDLFEGRIVFNGDIRKMFNEALQRKEDYKFIQEQMEFVKKEHTYVNRVKSILSIL